ARNPPRPRMTQVGLPPLTVVAPANRRDLIQRKEVAERLDHHPNAKPGDHLLAVDIRAQDEASKADELINQAIATYRNAHEHTLVALGSWMYEHARFEQMLEIVPADRAVRRRELLLQRIDALAALGRYKEIEDLLEGENS